jgi:prepilin-type processing-associated H-X9-DG protein/prepilin-type N-terminal cleavage/methylation domain-containing protein
MSARIPCAARIACAAHPRVAQPSLCAKQGGSEKSAFTLVELLVVIGIVALLVSVLMPAMASARRASLATACLSQMRQIGVATTLYTQDARGLFPRSSHSALAAKVMPWGYALCPYLGREPYEGPGDEWNKLFATLYRCPADERSGQWSYGKSVWFELTGPEIGELSGKPDGPTYYRITDVRRASATVLFAELATGSMGDHIMAHYWYLGGAPEVDMRRHGKASNYLYVDGHAEGRPFKSTFDLTHKIDQWDPAQAQ